MIPNVSNRISDILLLVRNSNFQSFKPVRVTNSYIMDCRPWHTPRSNSGIPFTNRSVAFTNSSISLADGSIAERENILVFGLMIPLVPAH